MSNSHIEEIVRDAFKRSEDSMDETVEAGWTKPFEEVGIDSIVLVEVAVTLTDELGQQIHDYELQEAGSMGGVSRMLVARAQ